MKYLTVALPLSAGRMVRFTLFFRVFSAALSVLFRLSLGRDEFFKILTVSCLASSAFSMGKDRIVEKAIQLRIKEHGRHIRLAQPDKSAVAEHSFNGPHHQIARNQTPFHKNRLHGSSHQRSNRNRDAS